MTKIKCGEVLVIVTRTSAAQFKRSFGVLLVFFVTINDLYFVAGHHRPSLDRLV